MEFAFYFSAGVAVLATFRVITNTNPVHALLYLIISLLAVSMVFFALGAPFAGALEIIVYAGAIMVLFVFVVMMLNLGPVVAEQERKWLTPKVWIGPSILAGALLVELLVVLSRPGRRRHRPYLGGSQGRGHQPVRTLSAGGRTGLHAALGCPGRGLPPGSQRRQRRDRRVSRQGLENSQ